MMAGWMRVSAMSRVPIRSLRRERPQLVLTRLQDAADERRYN
jgi:hypothetical protein